MPGRKFNGGDYRYGFNGMENDNEIKGDGNHLDFGARGYDPRLGRWLKMDALTHMQPDQSPYKFGLNNPVNYVDPDGNIEWHLNTYLDKDGKVIQIKLVKASNNMIGVLHGFYKKPFTFQMYDYHDYIVHRTIRYVGDFGIFPMHYTSETSWSLFDNRGDIKQSNMLIQLWGSGSDPSSWSGMPDGTVVNSIDVEKDGWMAFFGTKGARGFGGNASIAEKLANGVKSFIKLAKKYTQKSLEDERKSENPNSYYCRSCNKRHKSKKKSSNSKSSNSSRRKTDSQSKSEKSSDVGGGWRSYQ